MNRNFKLSLIAAVLLGTSSLSAVELNSLSMTDYKVTDSFFDEAYLNGQFSLTSPSDDRNETSYNGNFNGYYNMRKMTLDNAYDFRIDGNYAITKSQEKGSDSEDNYNVLATGHMDKYLNNVNENLLVYGGSTLGYRKRAGVDDADDPYADIVAGVGYGRIYDATPYAKAIRILGDLQNYNIVKKDISKETVMKLAAIIAKQDEYLSKYSSREYKKYWFDDMGKLLQAEGATDSQLDAFGIVRIEEILFEQTIYPRYHGWIVRAGVGQILSNYDNSSEDPTLNLEFAYGLPVGIRGQFYENAKYSALLNDDTGHRFVNTMTYTYELSDIIGWENRWVFDYNKASDAAGKIVQTNTLSSTFSYYLSNKLSFDTTLSLYKVTDGIANNGNDDWEQKLFTGLKYRLK